MEGIFFIIGLAIYAYFCYSLQVIAQKTNTENSWYAWIPLLNVYLMCKIAQRPGWWLLLCLIPIVNIIIIVNLYMALAEARNKPGWIGILMLIPLVNFAVIGYLAFSD